MPSWKKIIVSGSQAHLAAVTASSGVLVGSNQQITTSPSTTFLSGSFSGSFFGNGSGLTGVTATFPVTQLTPLTTTAQVFINDGANKYATVAQFNSSSWAGVSGDILINGTTGVATIQPDSVALGTDTTGNYVTSVTHSTGITAIPAASEGAAVTISVSGASALNTNAVTKWTGAAFANSSLTDNGTTITGTTSIQLTGANSSLTGSFSGSHIGPLTGTASWATNALTASNITPAITNNADNRVLTANGDGTVNGEANLTFDGSTLAVTGATRITGDLTVSGSTTLGDTSGDSVTVNAATVSIPNVGAGTTDTVIIRDGSNTLKTRTIDTRVWGSTLISGSGTANQVAFFNAATGITGSAGFTFSSNTLTAPNVTITNNLIVQGTASFQETTNLTVADRFILLASGSNSAGEGGIVVQQATQGVGEVFAWDNDSTRWAVTSSFSANQPSFVPDAFMAAVVTAAGTTPSPATRYNAVGNIYVSSGDESIWIYS